MFIDGYERADVVEDRVKFLECMKNLKPYLVEFEADGTIKTNIYTNNYQVNADIRRLVICITHNQCRE